MIKLGFDEQALRQAFQKREWLKNYAFISDLWVEGARNQFEQDKKLIEELQAKLEMAINKLNWISDGLEHIIHDDEDMRQAKHLIKSIKTLIQQLEESK